MKSARRSRIFSILLIAVLAGAVGVALTPYTGLMGLTAAGNMSPGGGPGDVILVIPFWIAVLAVWAAAALLLIAFWARRRGMFFGFAYVLLCATLVAVWHRGCHKREYLNVEVYSTSNDVLKSWSLSLASESGGLELVAGYFREIGRRQVEEFRLFPNPRIWWDTDRSPPRYPIPPRQLLESVSCSVPLLNRHGFGWFINRDDGKSMDTVSSVGITLPDWFIVLLSGVFATACLLPVYRRGRRRKRGLCVGCGYDLRASIGRCPECGEPVLAVGGSRASFAITECGDGQFKTCQSSTGKEQL